MKTELLFISSFYFGPLKVIRPHMKYSTKTPQIEDINMTKDTAAEYMKRKEHKNAI